MFFCAYTRFDSLLLCQNSLVLLFITFSLYLVSFSFFLSFHNSHSVSYSVLCLWKTILKNLSLRRISILYSGNFGDKWKSSCTTGNLKWKTEWMVSIFATEKSYSLRRVAFVFQRELFIMHLVLLYSLMLFMAFTDPYALSVCYDRKPKLC